MKKNHKKESHELTSSQRLKRWSKAIFNGIEYNADNPTFCAETFTLLCIDILGERSAHIQIKPSQLEALIKSLMAAYEINVSRLGLDMEAPPDECDGAQP